MFKSLFYSLSVADTFLISSMKNRLSSFLTGAGAAGVTGAGAALSAGGACLSEKTSTR